MISYDDFKKLEMVTAMVLEVEDHSNADRLFVVKVDIGGETRQVVAGIRGHYKKEELIGKEVIVLKNLQTATIRGVESNGMILATKDGDKLAVLIPEKEVKVGSSVS